MHAILKNKEKKILKIVRTRDQGVCCETVLVTSDATPIKSPQHDHTPSKRELNKDDTTEHGNWTRKSPGGLNSPHTHRHTHTLPKLTTYPQTLTTKKKPQKTHSCIHTHKKHTNTQHKLKNPNNLKK